MIKFAPWLIALFASITSVKFSVDNQGVRIELMRSQERVAELETVFELASCVSLYVEDEVK